MTLAKLAGASTFALALATLPSAGAEEPLAIAKQGYFFVDGKYATVGDKLLAGAPGFEPGNGGIKIHLFRLSLQRLF